MFNLRIIALLTLCFCLESFANDTLLIEVNSRINLDSINNYLEILARSKQTVINGINTQISSRQANSYGNHLAAVYINQQFKEIGYESQINHYNNYLKNGIEYPAENVIAISKGTEYPDKYVVICAHYDACATADDTIAYGADDNASGVVAVLEAARVLKNYNHKYSIMFAIFDHEEYGPMGSFCFVDSLANKGTDIVACINVDMIGYYKDDEWETYIYLDTTHKADFIADFISNSADLLNLKSNVIVSDKLFFSDDSYMIITHGIGDGCAFINNDYPAITIVENTKLEKRNPYYHTIDDKIENMNLPYFYDNVRLSIVSLASVAEVYSSVSSVKIDEDFKINLIYPNPASDYIEINIDCNSNVTEKISVLNAYGENVISTNINPFSQNFKINIENLASGVYYLVLKNKVEKFIVVR